MNPPERRDDDPPPPQLDDAGVTPPADAPDVSTITESAAAEPSVIAEADSSAESSVIAEEDSPAESSVVTDVADPAVEEIPAAALRRGLPSILESLLFVADRPLSSVELAQLVAEPEPKVVDAALAALAREWLDRGVHLHEVAGAWQFRSNPENAAWVQRLLAHKPVRLTRSQLETLAIAAYRQPITRPEIDEIRGVDTGGTLKTLLDRSLVRILGKKEEPGRPLLYGTTKEFLEFFNLRDLRELPTLREFHELSDEHRAQVEALEKVAPPGAVERPPLPGGIGDPLPPLQRVDVSDENIEEDLGAVDALIASADGRARAAAEAFGVATTPPPSTNPADADPDADKPDFDPEL